MKKKHIFAICFTVISGFGNTYAADSPSDSDIRAKYTEFQDDQNFRIERIKTATPEKERRFVCNFRKYITLGDYKILKKEVISDRIELQIDPHFIATEDYEEILKKEKCAARNRISRSLDKEQYGEIVKGKPISGRMSAELFTPDFTKVNGKWK